MKNADAAYFAFVVQKQIKTNLNHSTTNKQAGKCQRGHDIQIVDSENADSSASSYCISYLNYF